MALPINILQQVQTYQSSGLAYLLNLNCFVSTCNTKFKDFQNLTANLGSTVTFDLPPRYVTNDTLIVNFQGSQQRVHSLSVDQSKNIGIDFTNQQFVFNVKDYMQKFGMAALHQLSSTVEENVALNAKTQPYRFYGDGRTAINSFGQLAQMLANYRNYGAPSGDVKVYLDDLAIPAIVNTGANQFTPDRNNEMVQSWMVGNWQGAKFLKSNFLPLHTAGNVGNDATTLTVVSTDDPTGANITQITFSGAGASDADAIKQYDSFQFNDGVSGQPNMRFLTFIGQHVSGQPVQFRATADAASNGGGQVTVSIYPALCSQAGNPNQNLNNNIVAGMQVSVLPDHRCGLIVGGNALYLAMPRLPEETPFPTANKYDPDTGVSFRMYYGSQFGQNQRGIVNDIIWGSTGVPEYLMKIVFPA